MIVLQPEENQHYKQISTGEIFPNTLFLGIYDKPENYVLVDEAEYQVYLAAAKEDVE